jgi:hypothetical protein
MSRYNDRRYLTADDVALLDKIVRARAASEWAEYWPGPRDPAEPPPDTWVIGFVVNHLERMTDVELEDLAALAHAEIERRYGE